VETDQTIEVERALADVEYQKQQAELEKTSRETIERARERVDQTLHEVRAAVDETPLPRQARLKALRAAEHDTVANEREAADARLARERKERKLALAQLLRFEREATDEQLMIERVRADDAVAARDEFLALVSHDLRNLLGGIAMSAAQIVGEPDDEVGQRNLKARQRIRHFSARMNRLVGDLVDVTSIEAGRLKINPEVFELEALLVESGEAFQPHAAAKHVSLLINKPPIARNARGDPERLLQVLANLLSNAIKFTPEGGTVTLALELGETEDHFSVTDTGIGVPADQLEAVFERFWQVTKSDRRGLGLGLFISKCLVEAHGGRIWATSVPGQGSAFHFTLPR
jgi:signal transduction histidine kinase